MPLRRTRAAQRAEEEDAEQPEAEVEAVPDEAGPSTRAKAQQASPPRKRSRRSDQAQTEQPDDGAAKPSAIADEYSPPPAPIDEPPPPPAPVGEPPPPPPEDVAPPAPPPADLAPPPPPPVDPAADSGGREEEEIQDAEYWERIAREQKQKDEERVKDLYLETINRNLLDFDFEKLCSVSLSNINIYACLVCGKYFQGRGKSSYAYFHSIDEGHRVYMNLETSKFYILPDNYEVDSPALSDIRYLLHPTYSTQQIKRLDAPDSRPSLDLQGKTYRPGFVGLNNVGGNDYINVVLQALAHVTPIRNYFLAGKLRADEHHEQGNAGVNLALTNSSELVRRFAALVRKLWNPRAFKAQVSPHEFLQEVNSVSKGRFRLMEQGDPVDFLGWLLNQLHMDLTHQHRKRPSVVSTCFQGEVRIESQKVYVRTGLEADDDLPQEAVDKLDSDGRKEGGQEDEHGNAKFNLTRDVQVARSPFFLLALDLPPPPVFQDAQEKNIIPQVSIASLLAKYDGVSFQEARGMIRRYKVARLPPYVVLHFRRFTRNNFVEERNPTIVHFPSKGLDLADYADDAGAGEASLATLYDLVANVTHEAAPGTVREQSVWRAQVHTAAGTSDAQASNGNDAAQEQGVEGGERWFQMQDLFVEEVNRQMLFLQETYLQIWRRRGAKTDERVEEVVRRHNAAVAEKEREKAKQKAIVK